jgi:ferredoxin--NADP+ reductase
MVERPPGTAGIDAGGARDAAALPGVLPGTRLYVVGAGAARSRLERLARGAAASGDFEQVLLVHDCPERVDLGCEDCPLARGPAPAATPGPVCVRQYRAARSDRAGLAPIAELLTSGQLAAALGTPSLDPRRDRLLVCGTPQFASQLREILSVWGFSQSERGVPGEFAVDFPN